MFEFLVNRLHDVACARSLRDLTNPLQPDELLVKIILEPAMENFMLGRLDLVTTTGH